MLGIQRRNHTERFSESANPTTRVLLTVFFTLGLLISWRRRVFGTAAYLVAWLLSYGVIYAGTCRNCAYYGKPCPIPLEGSCVQVFVPRGDTRFGYGSLFWATSAYVMRVSVPAAILHADRLIAAGAAYTGILALFWINHLWREGCPNCINLECPLNPDHGSVGRAGNDSG
ncbi:MAG: hypothetical protein ACP5G0_08830 [Desulfomonilia bacterium]